MTRIVLSALLLSLVLAGHAKAQQQPACEPTVRKIIQEHLDPKKKIEMGATLEQLGADELDPVELVMAMEEEFNIEIPDADAERVFGKTLRDITLYLFQRKACK